MTDVIEITPALTISDTPPPGAVPGDLWWDSRNGILLVRYDDGNSVQWVSTVPTNEVDTALILSDTQIDSPHLVGIPTAPTAPAGTSTTQIATTEFVARDYAPLDSPHFRGEPTAPTPPTPYDDSDKLATTAFVQSLTIIGPSLADDAIPLKAFVSVGDAHQNTDGSWTPGTEDPTQGILNWIDACIASKRWGKASKGNWFVPFGDIIWRWDNIDGLHLFGEGDDSNFIFGDPLNGNAMWYFGTHRNRGSYYHPDETGITLVDPTTSASDIIKLSSLVLPPLLDSQGNVLYPGAPIKEGMTLVFADQTQPVRYHTSPTDIAGRLGQTIKIKKFIDAANGIVQLDGITEFNYNRGTWIGCVHNPVKGLQIRNMRFSYDPVNSHKGGVSSAVQVAGYDRFTFENITFTDATTRVTSWVAGAEIEMHGVRGECANDDAGLMNFQHWCQGGHVSDITWNGGIHLVGFGGDNRFSGTAHIEFSDCTSYNCNAPINNHWNARNCSWDRMRCIGTHDPWDTDDNPDTDNAGDKGAAITIRGYGGMKVTNSYVARFPLAYQAHDGTDNYFYNNVAEDCGRAIIAQNCDKLRVDTMIAKNCRYYNADITVNVGPNQGFPKFTNMVFKDIHSIGTPPNLGDFNLTLAQHLPSELKRLGWVLGPMSRNGEQAVCVGNGTASTMFLNSEYTPSPGTEIGGQFVGPFVQTEIVLGAMSATPNIAGVTKSYVPYERLPLAGGTYAQQASLRVITTQLKSFSVAPIVKTGSTTSGSARVVNVGPPPTVEILPGMTVTDSAGALPAGAVVRATGTASGDTNGGDNSADQNLQFFITNASVSGLEWAVGFTITDSAGDLQAGTAVAALGGYVDASAVATNCKITGDGGTGPGTLLTVNGTTDGAWIAGLLVRGAGVPRGTLIVAQLSGTTGGDGTYRINNSATLPGAREMKGYAFSANAIELSKSALGATNANSFSIKTVAGSQFAVSAAATATVDVDTFTIDSSRGHAAGNVITALGGVPVSTATRATIGIDTVDGVGHILTAHLISGGEYKFNDDIFGQAATTGTGTGARFSNLVFAPMQVVPYKTGDYTVGATPANPVSHENTFTGTTVNDVTVKGSFSLGDFEMINIVSTIGGGVGPLPSTYVGQSISGPGIPGGTIIAAVAPAAIPGKGITLTMSAASTQAVNAGVMTIRLASSASIASPMTRTNVYGRVISVVPDPVSAAIIGQSISDTSGDMASDMTVQGVTTGVITLSRPVTNTHAGNNITTRAKNAGSGCTFNVTWGNCIDMGNTPKTGVDVVDLPPTSSLNTLDYMGSTPGVWRIVRFSRAITLTHNAARINLNRGGSNIITDVGDIGTFLSDSAGVYNLIGWSPVLASAYLAPRTTFPTPPVSGLLVWANDDGRQLRTQPSGAVRAIMSPNRRLFRASGRDNTATPVGDTLATDAVATATAVVSAGTNLYTRQARTSRLSTTGLNKDAYWELPFSIYADDPGYLLFKFSWELFAPAPVLFIGLKPTGGMGSTNPSTTFNTFGIGANGGASPYLTLRRFLRDNSHASSIVDLGANFPSNTQLTDMYEIQLMWNALFTRAWVQVLRTNSAGQQWVYQEVINPGTPASVWPLPPGVAMRAGIWTSTGPSGTTAIQPALHDFVVEL